MLIVEGNDCLGKTTVVNKLCTILDERYNLAVVPQHFGLLPTSWDYFNDYVPFINSRVVMDRFIMSEVVYGYGLRNGAKLTPERYERLQARLTLVGAMTVLITCLNDNTYGRILDEHVGRAEEYDRRDLMCMNAVWRNAWHKVGDFERYDFKIDYSIDVFENEGRVQWPPDCTLRLIAQEYYRRQTWTPLD